MALLKKCELAIVEELVQAMAVADLSIGDRVWYIITEITDFILI